jgi:hypothetical protein
MLHGEIAAVIHSLRWLGTHHKLKGKRGEALTRICGYFHNNAHRRVKLNSDPWERTGIREIGYCYPMGAGFGPIPMRGG